MLYKLREHTKNKERSIGKEEKRMSLNIDKNGRIFAVECIIFQDDILFPESQAG